MRSEGKEPVIVGILNVTPDSFSDGGKFTGVEAALAQARLMVAEGAGIVDIGGESTRPGAERVNPEKQIMRVEEIIRRCRDELPAYIRISIDTTQSRVAAAAIDAGADIINDVAAGRDDQEIMDLAAQKSVLYILMHMQGMPKTMQNNPCYENVTLNVKRFLLARVELAVKAGIREDKIILDPGIGFGKTREHNLQLIRELNELVEIGFPVLLGTSRKRFMGTICEETSSANLIGSTCATTALGVIAGVKYFRVHDVKANHQAATVAWAIKNS